MLQYDAPGDAPGDEAISRLRSALDDAVAPIDVPRPATTPVADDDRDTAEGRQLGVVWSVLLVLGAFVLLQVPMAIGFARAIPDPPGAAPGAVVHQSFWDSNSWGQYDSWLYLEIAKSGYYLEPCTYAPSGSAAGPGWCGNSGWTPAYPGLIRAGEGVGFARETSAFWWPRLCTFALLAILWFVAFRRRLTPRNVVALLLASVWPGAVYLLALYPMSLVVLCLLLVAWAMARGRPLLAGLAAAVVVTGHTVGFYVVGFVLLWLMLEHGWQYRRHAWRAAAWFLAPVVVSVVAMLAMFQATTGHWNALTLSQQKYGHHLLFLPTFLYQRLSLLWDNPTSVPLAPVVQTAVVTVLVLTALVIGVARWHDLRPIESLSLVIGVGFWVTPLLFGREDAAYYRVEILTLPVLVVLRRLPTVVLGIMVAVGAILSVAITTAYLQSQLV